mmetsp:Transcript_28183/g.61283  ORF Transcript_28183/g.61283 Transcript_28183/m.61283 type:complete len:302 (-) Transcript_28183:145-1050(-)
MASLGSKESESLLVYSVHRLGGGSCSRRRPWSCASSCKHSRGIGTESASSSSSSRISNNCPARCARNKAFRIFFLMGSGRALSCSAISSAMSSSSIDRFDSSMPLHARFMRLLSWRAFIFSSLSASSASGFFFSRSRECFISNMALKTRSLRAFISDACRSTSRSISSAMHSRSLGSCALSMLRFTFSFKAWMSEALLAISVWALSHSSAMAWSSPERFASRRVVANFRDVSLFCTVGFRRIPSSRSSTPEDEEICCSKRATCCSHCASQDRSAKAGARDSRCTANLRSPPPAPLRLTGLP